MMRIKLLMGLFAGLGCVALQAQTPRYLTAKIPFDFQLGKTAMPAGEYRIGYSDRMLTLQCWDQHKSAMVVPVPRSRDKAAEKPVVKFNRYGDAYFFEGVWLAGSTDGAGVVQTSQEKEIARRVGTKQLTAITLNASR